MDNDLNGWEFGFDDPVTSFRMENTLILNSVIIRSPFEQE